MEWNSESRNRHAVIWSIDFYTHQSNSMEKEKFFQQRYWNNWIFKGTGYSYGKKPNFKCVSHSSQKLFQEG